MVLDFDVTAPSSLATPDSSGATSAIEEEESQELDGLENALAMRDAAAAAANPGPAGLGAGAAAAAAFAGFGDPNDIGVELLDNPVQANLLFGDDAIV